jgi:hypothetical protein
VIALLVRLVLAGALLGGYVAVAGQPALAECIGPPWPSFTEVAPSAKSVFVGTVVDVFRPNRSSNNWFTLRVDEVLRGKAPALVDFEAFESGLSSPGCDPYFVQVGGVGERYAFALDARVADAPDRVNAVALIKSDDADPLTPGAEELSLTKVRRLAGQAADGSTSSSPRGPSEGPLSRAVVKRVAPGVWRVTDDWTGHNVDRVRLVEAGPNGTIWLGGTRLLSRLGQPGTIKTPGSLLPLADLDSRRDGELLATGEHAATFDGQLWTKLIGDSTQDPWRTHVTFVPDGSAWAGWSRRTVDDNPGYARWDGESWSLTEHPCWCITTGFAEDSNGDLWMGVYGWNADQDYDGAGLFRLDDGVWQEVQPLDTTEAWQVYGMAAGPDGTLWVSLIPEGPAGNPLGDYSRSYLARWDGESWTGFEWPLWVHRTLMRIDPYQDYYGGNRAFFGPDMTVDPEGALWFERPLMSFDGETWRSYSVPSNDEFGPRVSDLSIDPEGMVWLSVRDFTNAVPGRPHRLYVIDPTKASPARIEKATAQR